MSTRVLTILFAAALAGNASASESDEKRGYSLFNPIPRDQMREMSADRPDSTESPISVDAGHVQIEASFFDYTRDDEDGADLRAWTIMDTNVKLGLTHSSDLQFVFGSYTDERIDLSGDMDERTRGFGDLTIRYKRNFWGNDGGTKTAFGVMPFVTIPTGSDLSTREPAGGIIAMLAWDVAENWGLGFQAEFDAEHNSADDNHDAVFQHTTVLGFDVAGPLGAFVEYHGVQPFDGDDDYEAYFNTGATYALTADVALDAGVRIGLNDAAEDFGVFSGITLRF